MEGLIGSILAPILKIIDKAVPDKTEAARLQNEITKALIEQKGELMKTMKEISVKELEGTPYQRNWRPTLSWMVILLWPYNFIARPIMAQLSGLDLPAIDTGDLATLTTMWSAVYGLGRSFEKSGSSIKMGS